ncbi:AraC family transcriptional regulator [Micromonospora sp. NPDC023888]|uniref:AraC family transcriptional regulator n=1 Tax=Micromonospora sp. NPDC023888 TaxID=3155607 RepID=UPI00340374D7
MDPLSHVLALSNIEGAVCAELRAGGEWAIAFRGQLHVKFGVVLSGACWLTVETVKAPLHLRQGDCYLVVGGQDYQLASTPGITAMRSEEVWTSGEDVGYCGNGHDTTLVGGRLHFDRANGELLLNALPSVVHLAADADPTGVLRATIQLLTYETAAPRPGQTLMLDHLARIILLHGLRAHLTATAVGPPGERAHVAALLDPGVDAALKMMHDDVARTWSIDELARTARMSRSVFTEKFKAVVGESPGRYLLSLRMHTAKQILLKSDRTISSVAAELGYSSEAAFSTAFKRVMGAPPRDYRASRAAGDTNPAVH